MKLLFAFFALFFPLLVHAEEARMFTNEDLKGYQDSPDGDVAPAGTEVMENGPSARPRPRRGSSVSISRSAPAGDPSTADRKTMDYYCRTGSRHSSEVAKLRDQVNLHAAKLKELELQSNPSRSRIASQLASAKDRKQQAENELKDAERRRNDFELEAHRRNIPAGWLRCQFE